MNNNNNSIQPPHNPLSGAMWMIIAGVTFALINTGIQYLGVHYHIASSNIAFWQYLIALVALVPWVLKHGIVNAFKTRYWKMHVVRVVLAVIGVQLWTMAMTKIPMAQGIALLMTSPLFATLGSGLILKEKVGKARWLATVAGFIGAMIILEPWSSRFSWASLLPVCAALFWAGYSLMVKKQSTQESPVSLVVFLFVLMIPINLSLAIPSWSLPVGASLWVILVGMGCLTTLAQWTIAKAYSVADASFVQPFDHAKLPLNVLLGWLIFSQSPPMRFWIGAAVIVAAVSFITRYDHKKRKTT